jgi:uncharacterized protein (DUF952 family)
VRQNEYRPASFENDGFIHFSRPHQALAVANRYYSQEKDLLLLWIDQSRLRSALRWEQSEGQLFPHLYSLLNLDAVSRVSPLMAGSDGRYQTLEKE